MDDEENVIDLETLRLRTTHSVSSPGNMMI